MSSLPAAPIPGQTLAPAWPDPRFLGFLAQRRSTPIALLTGPGPDPHELADLLRIAARTPDHGKLAPWRFIVFRGEGRVRAGEALAARRRSIEPAADESVLAPERGRFLRAPVVVAVVSRAAAHPKIPEWEQILSAGAACYGALLAAQAMGYAGVWLSEWCAYDVEAMAALGIRPGERVAGFLYLGTATAAPTERDRPLPPDLITIWE